MGGLRSSKPPSAGYLNSSLSKPPLRSRRTAYSSREATRANQAFDHEETHRGVKRRRLEYPVPADANMSKEDPIIVADDDEVDPIALPASHASPRALKYGERTKGSRELVTNPISISEYNNVQTLIDPRSNNPNHQRGTPRKSKYSSDEDEDGFTRTAKAQRQYGIEQSGSRQLTNETQMPERDSLESGEKSLRQTFTGSNGRRRNSKLESPDILSGDATVGPSQSPLAKPRRRLKNNDESSLDGRKMILKDRAKNGPRAEGFPIVDFELDDIILPREDGYLLVRLPGRLAIMSSNARLGSDPISSIMVQQIVHISHSKTSACIRIRDREYLRFAFLRLHSEKQLIEVVMNLQKENDSIKIVPKPDEWITKTWERHNLHADPTRAQRTLAEATMVADARSNRTVRQPDRNENVMETPVKTRVQKQGPAQISTKIKDQLKASESTEDELSRNIPELFDETASIARRTDPAEKQSRLSSVSGSGGIRSAETGCQPHHIDRPRRTTRQHVSTYQLEEDVQEVVDPNYVPFSKTGQLGPEWQKPLIYPKSGKKRAEVEFRDLERLDDNEFLNDNLIGFFLRFLEHDLQHSHPDLAQRIYFFNSYFFATLTSTARTIKKGINYEGVQKWTRGVNLFERDFVIVPINENAHWYVAIICNLKKVLPQVGEEPPDAETDPVDAQVVTTEHRAGTEDTNNVEQSPQPESPNTKRQPLQDITLDRTSESMGDLSLSDQESAQNKDVNNTGSLFANFITSASTTLGIRSKGKDAKSMNSPKPEAELDTWVLEPNKSRKARNKKTARRSGVGLTKYDTDIPIVITMDSLGLGRSATTRALKEYLVEEAQAKLGANVDIASIKGMTARGIPSQSNYSDCGLYLLAYMEKFILDPYGFVEAILIRQMDELAHWPLMESSDLRNRLRKFLLKFHEAQDNGEEVPSGFEIGRILLGMPRRGRSRDDTAHQSQTGSTSKYFSEYGGSLTGADCPPGDRPPTPGEHPAVVPSSSINQGDFAHQLKEAALQQHINPSDTDTNLDEQDPSNLSGVVMFDSQEKASCRPAGSTPSPDQLQASESREGSIFEALEDHLNIQQAELSREIVHKEDEIPESEVEQEETEESIEVVSPPNSQQPVTATAASPRQPTSPRQRQTPQSRHRGQEVIEEDGFEELVA